MQLSLTQKSIALVAAMALVLLGAYSIFSIYYVGQTTQRLTTTREAHAKSMAEDLDQFLERASKKLVQVAETPGLVHGIEAQETDRQGREIPSSERLHYIFLQAANEELKGGGVFLVNRAGKILWTEPRKTELIDTPYALYPAVEQAILANKDAPSVLTLTTTGTPQILISAPLIEHGEIVGALIGAIPIDHETIRGTILSDDNDGVVQLIDPSGTVIASTENSRAMLPLPYREAVFSSEGIHTGTLQPKGFENSVVAVAELPNNKGWAITNDQERGIALADANRLKNILTAFGIVLILLVMAILFFVLRTFTRPIELLTADARRIAAGDLNVKFTSGRTDEIGLLGATLDEMKLQVKTSYERLLISEKMALMGQIVSGIAHELNNPLTIVMGHTQLLLQDEIDDKLKGSLTRINDGAERAAKIVRNLLTFARQQKPERKITDVNAVLLKTIELRAYELRVCNVELATELSPIPLTMTDPHQLQQVFLNLIVNAEQAMLEANGRGRLSIKSRATDGRIEVVFEDDGPGISQENLRRIFDPFFTTKPVGKGTGLGLSICQGIIAEHGGRLTASSTPGSGTCFSVDLPIVAAGTPHLPVITNPTLKAQQHKNVLVVDDEGHLREMFCQILSGDGHKIQTATNGKEAMELVHCNKFDLVITDVKMPETDGAEFYRQLKSEGLAIADRLLFVTGDLMNPETLRFLESTGNPWIAKPFEVSAAREAINQVLNKVLAIPA